MSNPNSQKAMRLSDLIPTNWLDPLLTGPNAALPGVGDTIEPKHIEVLLRRLKQRVQEAEELFGPADPDYAVPSIEDLRELVKLPADNQTHIENLEKAYGEARRIIMKLLPSRSASEAGAER